MADLNEDDIFKANPTPNHLLMLRTFSSLSNIATSTPAAKQHRIIVLIGTLTG